MTLSSSDVIKNASVPEHGLKESKGSVLSRSVDSATVKKSLSKCIRAGSFKWLKINCHNTNIVEHTSIKLDSRRSKIWKGVSSHYFWP